MKHLNRYNVYKLHAFLRLFKAFSKTDLEVPTFKRIKPSPPGPNIEPSFKANPALKTNKLTSSF